MRKCISILALVLVISNCAPAPAPVQAWKVLDTVSVTVDAAMSAAGDLYRAGKISETQKSEIVQVYDVYRVAALQANSLIRAWNTASPKATDTPPAITAALADVSTKSANVLTMTKLYGVTK